MFFNNYGLEVVLYVIQSKGYYINLINLIYSKLEMDYELCQSIQIHLLGFSFCEKDILKVAWWMYQNSTNFKNIVYESTRITLTLRSQLIQLNAQLIEDKHKTRQKG